MKKTAVVFASSGLYSIGVCINVMALEEKSPDLADKYIIFYDNWDPDVIKKLSDFSPKVEFIEYTREMFDEKYAEKFNDDPHIENFLNRFSHLSTIVPDILLLLERFNQIIYMEPDFIVLTDVTKLKNINDVAWRSGLMIDNYNGKKLDRPNGGLLLFPDSIPYNELSQKYFDYFVKTKNNEISLCRMMSDYNISVLSLDADYNFCHQFFDSLVIKDKLKLVHTAGIDKIWNKRTLRCLFPEYEKYLDHFGYECTSQNDEIFSSRDEFIKFNLRIEVWKKYLFKSPALLSLNFDFLSLFEDRLVFRYKNYNNIRFNVRILEFGKCRIYFQMREEHIYKMADYIHSREDCEVFLKAYKEFDYNNGIKVFHIDIRYDQLSVKFAETVELFTRLSDDFYKSNKLTEKMKIRAKESRSLKIRYGHIRK